MACCFFFLLHTSNTILAHSFTAFSGQTPISGTSDFNSLYSGSFVDLTGIHSANGTGLLAANIAGYDFRLLASSAAADCGIGIEPFTAQTAMVYGYTNSGLTNLTALEVTSNDGKFFDLQSVDISIDGLSSGISQNVRLVGYQGGNPVAGALLVHSVTAASNGGVLVTFNVAGNTSFIGVDKFRIETDGSYTISGAIGADNINAINFRGILPITLVSYSGILQNNTVVLNWRMVSELNSSNFIIERSCDGIRFSTIGNISFNPDHIGVAENSFVDMNPDYGNNYYRITLVELMEEQRCLGVIKVFRAYNQAVALFPNPVSGSSITLQSGDANNIKQQYTITSLTGKTMQGGNITDYLQQINVSDIPRGIYMLHLSNGATLKFQKQ